MFSALTSFTGGGGINAGSSADGDNEFNSGAFSYKGNSSGGNQLIVVGLISFACGFIVAKVI